MVRRALLSLVVIGLLPPPVDATDLFSKVHLKTELTVLTWDRGARAIGMGGVGTSDLSPDATGFYNPASLAWADGTSLQWSHESKYLNFFSFSDYRLTTSIPLPWSSHEPGHGWRFGGGLAYSDMTSSPRVARTVFLPEGTGETFKWNDWYASAIAAAAWEGDGVSVGIGASAKYVNESLGSGDLNAWAFDAGLIAAFPVVVDSVTIRPRAGVMLANMSTGIDEQGYVVDVANRGRYAAGVDVSTGPVGVGSGMWRRQVSVLSTSVDFDFIDPGVGKHEWALGWEVSGWQAVQLRFGTHQRSGTGFDANTIGAGLGWDFGSWRVQLDYANVAYSSNVAFFSDQSTNVFGIALGGRL